MTQEANAIDRVVAPLEDIGLAEHGACERILRQLQTPFVTMVAQAHRRALVLP